MLQVPTRSRLLLLEIEAERVALSVVSWCLYRSVLRLQLLAYLVEHDLLDSLDDTLVIVSDHLVDLVIGNRTLPDKAWLGYYIPISSEQDATLLAALADFDQFLLHEHALLDALAFLE